MKRGNSFQLHLITFFSGALISYFLTQFHVLHIDKEVNISESLLSIITALVGLYIAGSLQKSHNRNQNLFSYVESKFDAAWGSFSSFSKNIKYSHQIDLNTTISIKKEIDISLNSIDNILDTFNIDKNKIKQIEQDLDTFFQLIENCPIQNNIYDLSQTHHQLNQNADTLNKAFASLLKEMHILI